MKRFGPKALPGLELQEGVPASLRTMVVVPTLLTTREEIEEQIERLEVHYLANQDGDIRFTGETDRHYLNTTSTTAITVTSPPSRWLLP